MKRVTLTTLASILMLSITCNADIYVDPINGNDSNNGATATSAFKTLLKARDTMRSKKLNQNLEKDLNIYLREGRYQLDKTFILDARDSGRGGHDVVYKAYKNETPIICGGRRITDWKPVDGKPYFVASAPVTSIKRKNVMYPGRSEALHPRFYSVQGLSADSFAPYFAQLYVNGVRAERARSNTPITGSRKAWYDDPHTTEWRDGIYVDKSKIKDYTNPEDIRLLYLELFKTFDAPIKTLIYPAGETNEAVLVARQPAFNLGSSWNRIQPNTPFFVVNALEELDEPGEWYLNQKTRLVYYYPFKRDGDLNTAEVYAPRVEDLLRIDGYPVQRVSNIRLEGITFQHGNWTAAKDNYLGISQAEAFDTYKDQIPGQIVVDHADNITIRGCTVRHMGSCGIDIQEACNDILVEGNLTYDTTAAGITVGKWYIDGRDCSKESVCVDVMVRNNVVRNTGRDYWQGTGINIFAAYNCELYHNDVSDIAYTVLHARIGDSTFINPYIGKIIYRYNKVSRGFAGHKLGIGDGGHYYQHGRYPDSVISDNYSLYANRNVNMEYYPDNHSYKALWTNNVSRYSKAHGSTFFVKGHVTVTSNFSDNRASGRAKNHTIVKDDVWPEKAQIVMKNAGLEKEWLPLLNKTYGHENLAQGKRCWASSESNESMSAAKGSDGDWNSFWNTKAEGDGQGFWAVDLEKPYVIQKITILPRQDMYQDHARCNVEVQASNDPDFKTYIVLAEQNDIPWYHKTTGNASNLWEQFINIEKAYRYLRVKAPDAPGSFNFAEFGAYGHQPQSKK